MLKYELISRDDYSRLPLDPTDKWLAIEEICRTSLNGLLDDHTTQDSSENLKMQYLTTVSSAAEALGLPSFKKPSGNFEPAFQGFMIQVLELSTRLKLKSSSSAHEYSVRLRGASKSQIALQISNLRQSIKESEYSDSERKKALKKIDDLEGVFDSHRIDYARLFQALSIVGQITVNTATLAAVYPDAIANIISLVGQEKAAEQDRLLEIDRDASPLLLAAPPQEESSET